LALPSAGTELALPNEMSVPPFLQEKHPSKVLYYCSLFDKVHEGNFCKLLKLLKHKLFLVPI
jgi:hypothetical protein